MVRILLTVDDPKVRQESFSFERSQLFVKERIKPKQIEKIRIVVEKAEVKEKDPELKPFVREIPTRSTQLGSSVPAWAAGAKAEKTIGPLIRDDCRIVAIDFYRVVKLLGIYQQNSPLPVILFQARFRKITKCNFGHFGECSHKICILGYYCSRIRCQQPARRSWFGWIFNRRKTWA